MQNKLFIMLAPLLLASCGTALPGLQNVDIGTMQHMPIKSTDIKIEPIVIPITAQSLSDYPPAPYVYRIGPQDVLNIEVWDHPELNTAQMPASVTQSGQAAGATGYLVDSQGDINFPLVGTVHVAGQTLQETHNQFTKRLSYYVRRPQVLLRIADYRSKKVYVMGEVLRPGYLPMNDSPLSITEALNLMGSLDPNSSDPKHIYVMRGPLQRPKIYWLNVSSPTALLLGERFQLQPDDIVLVSAAVVTRWNRFLNQLLPTLQTVWYTKAITGK